MTLSMIALLWSSARAPAASAASPGTAAAPGGAGGGAIVAARQGQGQRRGQAGAAEPGTRSPVHEGRLRVQGAISSRFGSGRAGGTTGRSAPRGAPGPDAGAPGPRPRAG